MIDLLKRLSELAPACRIIHYSDGVSFAIGEYTFWQSAEFSASYQSTMITGRPALAWLQDAIKGAIEARGWDWDIIHTSKSKPEYTSSVNKAVVYRDNPTEALLTAFIEALEHESKNQATQPEN